MVKLLLKIFFGKEGVEMMAMLWVQSIVNGKKTFADVPVKLKDQVRELLIGCGLPELITE